MNSWLAGSTFRWNWKANVAYLDFFFQSYAMQSHRHTHTHTRFICQDVHMTNKQTLILFHLNVVFDLSLSCLQYWNSQSKILPESKRNFRDHLKWSWQSVGPSQRTTCLTVIFLHFQFTKRSFWIQEMSLGQTNILVTWSVTAWDTWGCWYDQMISATKPHCHLMSNIL